ncbi:hypothetical protein MUK42_18001 [Musa troglodytarum]|uniref:protein-ribulosamine 3-kinase n=1 Tax=Musa troglodytarum TaxID=320322 RepID=A0A9E7L671_9LILI|nr:hypothetical protein MUK42_18001 [Musa troglodytarum]
MFTGGVLFGRKWDVLNDSLILKKGVSGVRVAVAAGWCTWAPPYPPLPSSAPRLLAPVAAPLFSPTSLAGARSWLPWEMIQFGNGFLLKERLHRLQESVPLVVAALIMQADMTLILVPSLRIGPSMFEAEALGLSAMYATQSIRVPMPYKSVLGRKLAEMHQAGKSSKGFGFDIDNTIGSTPQINSWSSDWIEFFSEHRLGYQLKLALNQYGDSAMYEKGQRLMKNLQPLFEGVVIEPCLLHGDLWSGNISCDKNGDPVILDPACYYGHNEAEFGMSWCAGFGGSFYSSYFEVMPKQPGFEKRRDLYMLYHYLNHYNLFGSGYRSSAMSIIDDYLRMLEV